MPGPLVLSTPWDLFLRLAVGIFAIGLMFMGRRLAGYVSVLVLQCLLFLLMLTVIGNWSLALLALILVLLAFPASFLGTPTRRGINAILLGLLALLLIGVPIFLSGSFVLPWLTMCIAFLALTVFGLIFKRTGEWLLTGVAGSWILLAVGGLKDHFKMLALLSVLSLFAQWILLDGLGDRGRWKKWDPALAIQGWKARIRKVALHLTIWPILLWLSLLLIPLLPPSQIHVQTDCFEFSESHPLVILGPANAVWLGGAPWRESILASSRLKSLFLGQFAYRKLPPCRAVKSPQELRWMGKSAQITDEALLDALPLVKPGTTENELAQAIWEGMKKRGAEGVSFPLIVGAGANGVIIHHITDDTPFKEGDLVVVDIGCLYHGYASDMTRTLPVGKISARQREVYEAVLAAQSAGLATLRPGATLSEAQKASVVTLKERGLPAYPHSIGHGVGVEVHDPLPRGLKENMVVTVEPGAYLEDEGIGIRIEDTVVITSDGCRHLTGRVPTDLSRLEEMIAVRDNKILPKPQSSP